MPPALALPHEVGDLVALADPVPDDGCHPFITEGFGPHLNGDAPTLLFEGIGEPVEIAASQVVDGLTSVRICERRGCKR